MGKPFWGLMTRCSSKAGTRYMWRGGVFFPLGLCAVRSVEPRIGSYGVICLFRVLRK